MFIRTMFLTALVMLMATLPVSGEELLRVYCSPKGTNYLPHYNWPNEAKEPSGHEVDIARLVAEQLGKKIVFISVPENLDIKNYRSDLLQKGKADMVVSCFTITDARKKRVLFSTPYFTDGLGVLVRTDSKIDSVEDLRDSTIIAWDYTTAHSWISKHLPNARKISKWPKGYDGPPESIVEKKMADAYINDYTNLHSLAAENRNLRVFKQRLTTEHWGIAVAKDNVELKKKIDTALERLLKDGAIAKVDQKWFAKKR